VLFALLVLVVVGVRGFLRGARVRARSRRAFRGEREAVALLRARGYAVVQAQASAVLPVRVDGETFLAGLRADYVVSKNGARFVAEVKTGELAPSIATAATRRQLLEYEIAFGVDGILLVDADRGEVHAIEFPTLRAGRARRFSA
jgi:Holliday junction resolvase